MIRKKILNRRTVHLYTLILFQWELSNAANKKRGSKTSEYHLHINKHGMHISFSLIDLYERLRWFITSVERFIQVSGNSRLKFII